jgi:hypothetical protein
LSVFDAGQFRIVDADDGPFALWGLGAQVKDMEMHEQLSSLERLMTQRFDGLDSRVEDLARKVETTNGRVRQQEIEAAVQRAQIETLQRETGELRKGRWRLDEADESDRKTEDGESAFRSRIRDLVWAAGGGGGLLYAALKLIGKI